MDWVDFSRNNEVENRSDGGPESVPTIVGQSPPDSQGAALRAPHQRAEFRLLATSRSKVGDLIDSAAFLS